MFYPKINEPGRENLTDFFLICCCKMYHGLYGQKHSFSVRFSVSGMQVLCSFSKICIINFASFSVVWGGGEFFWFEACDNG